MLNYIKNEYFNEKDYYFIYSNGLYYISKVHFHKGDWYCNYGLQFKMTSVQCMKADKFVGCVVETKNPVFYGKVTNLLENNLGVYWYPNKYSEGIILNYWININEIKLVY